MFARCGPLEGFHRLVGRFFCLVPFADVKGAHPVIFKFRQGGVFGENIGRIAVFEGLAIAHGACDLRHDPPVGFGVTLQFAERALAGNAAFGIGDRAGFFAPTGGG